MRGWRRGQQPRDGEEPPGYRPGDADLVVAAQRDRRAFAPLYARYQDDLLRYAFYGLGDWDDAADASQQIFANALAGLGSFRDRGDSFRGWLFTIAHHEVGARQRRCARRAEGPFAGDDELEDPAPTPEELAIAR
ncbi:MAG: hypothetical protein QOJ59_3633, partial [Thermomicrobiales bacterium]|nr:hypothetical protein [Thermomicrobiales bacterium]